MRLTCSLSTAALQANSKSGSRHEHSHTLLTNPPRRSFCPPSACSCNQLKLIDLASQFFRDISLSALLFGGQDLQSIGVDVDGFIDEVCHAYRDHDKLNEKMLRDIMLGFRNSKNVTTRDRGCLRLSTAACRPSGAPSATGP